MCGIAGIWTFERCDLNKIIDAMNSALFHRGPDSDGKFIDVNVGLALGHTRLSIIDLSVAASQPMCSTCGRYRLIFNGEIYNYQQLRRELSGQTFETTSDTEVLLKLICIFGLEKSLQKCSGMFAIALWDSLTKTLYIARDRFGEKPLYYGIVDNCFVFASELKAIRTLSNWKRELNMQAIQKYVSLGYIPAPLSIYAGISKLVPGTIVPIKQANGEFNIGELKNYWSIIDQARTGTSNQTMLSVENTVEMLDVKLQASVQNSLAADVPLGAYLSSGVDSSTVVAIAQSKLSTPLKTFTIGNRDKLYDEAPEAEKIANFLKTEHITMYLEEDDYISAVEKLNDIYDEPFSDSSQIPTYLISKLARQHVTVALSGDGGDELFYGYNRYKLAKKLFYLNETIPKPIRSYCLGILRSVKLQNIPILRYLYLDQIQKYGRVTSYEQKIDKLAQVSELDDAKSIYNFLQQVEPASSQVLLNKNPLKDFTSINTDWLPELSFQENMMLADQQLYLPDDILTKVDRASMHVGLETRVPLLDFELVSLIWSIPQEYKEMGSSNKWLLRQVSSRYLPENYLVRKKKGFSIPIDKWIRGPLLEKIKFLLHKDKLIDEGYFNVPLIHQRLDEHIRCEKNWGTFLWMVFMFELWLENEKYN